MATLHDSLVSSSARVLPLRMRPDLSAQQQRYQGRVYWVVKEPVGLHYFRFQEEEYEILQMLDGESSLDQIKERFEDLFPPQKITVEELGQFVGMLHRSGLIIADVGGQGFQLKKRRDERKRKELLGALGNLLALRFKGIDPERLLNWLYPKVRWMYSRTAVTLCMLLALSALSLVMVEFHVFRTKLPTFHQFFTGSNWIWLGISLAVTKVIHEFGHGLTCKHFGGECHEMGVMFLVLTPCLYCNVSDSWMLPNKWHRAAIGAAGMYIEIVIASICTFLWWFSEPGLLNQICLSTMFVCSVSTVMFNANPLLRYDGYYILADLAEIPNLRQKATTILSRKMGSWCLGLEEPDDPFLPQQNQIFFALYTVAAAIYRWVVLFSILWFIYRVLEPYGLKVVSQTLAFVSVGGLVVQPLWNLGKFFYVPGRLDQIKRRNLEVTLAVVAAALVFVFACPLPYRVMCSLEVKPRDAKMVHVLVPGVLEEVFVKPGQQVKKGQPLARLSNLDLLISIAELKTKEETFKIRLDTLMRSAHDRESAALEMPQLRDSLAAIQEELRQKEQDVKRLTLTAPESGTVLPPPDIPHKPDNQGQLATWSGNPFEKKNLGAYLPTASGADSVLFCEIGDPRQLEARLVVEQDDMEFVREKDPVDIKLEGLSGHTYPSTITEVSRQPMKVTPRHLTNKAGGDVISKTDESGTERPQNVSYEARAPLDDVDGIMYIGVRGKGKVHADWQTVAERTWRYLIRTFNFKL